MMTTCMEGHAKIIFDRTIDLDGYLSCPICHLQGRIRLLEDIDAKVQERLERIDSHLFSQNKETEAVRRNENEPM